MLGAISDSMIDALIGLKMTLLLFLGVLILDELFLGIQTAEMANFYAARAQIVGLSEVKSTDAYNRSILRQMIFTKRNPFIEMDEIHTTNDRNQVKTKFQHYTAKTLRFYEK